MTDCYKKLKEFWNSNKYLGEVIKGKWIEDETFNRVLSENLSNAQNVLDYGCGLGHFLFEMAFTSSFKFGLGLDTAENSIEYAKESAVLSGLNNLSFVCADERLLDSYKDYFDFILSVNTLDVVPQEICDSMIRALALSLKRGSKIAICLNPEFSDEEFKSLGISFNGNYGYKNNIFRCNRKRHQEWISYFEKYLKLVEFNTFYLTESEKKYPPRMMFLMQRQ